MEVITIDSEAYKTLMDKMDQISGDIQSCRKIMEEQSLLEKKNILDKDWLNEKEVEELFGLNKRTLLRLRRSGQLKFSRVGLSKIIYFRRHIDEYLQNNIQDKSKNL